MTDVAGKEEGIQRLFRAMPQEGRVEWIGARPSKGARMIELETVRISVDEGLDGDRFDGGQTRKRQVTLIQREHLNAVANILGKESIDPQWTRRNLVISGINLQALKNTRFQIGSVVFEGIGNCPPCSQMEDNLGVGGFNAMRGHGGLCAKVVVDGQIAVGDSVRFLELAS